MRIIAIMNQKGGVGKTTTSVNMAAGLAMQGKKVCLVDLDPQGHSSLHLGIEPFGNVPTAYDVFSGFKTLAETPSTGRQKNFMGRACNSRFGSNRTRTG